MVKNNAEKIYFDEIDGNGDLEIEDLDPCKSILIDHLNPILIDHLNWFNKDR